MRSTVATMKMTDSAAMVRSRLARICARMATGKREGEGVRQEQADADIVERGDEAEDRPGDDAGARERQRHLEQRLPWAGA